MVEESYGRAKTAAGSFALAMFAIAFITIAIAFATPYWLESDPRFYGTQFEKLGLWTFCFRSLPDPYDYDHRRYFSGCRWLFDPFTTGWRNVGRELVAPFFAAVQFFFTMSLILLLVDCILVPMYILCFGPESKHYVNMLRIIGANLVIASVLAGIAVIIFGAKGAERGWMPGYQNNYLSWSFGLAVVGAVAELVAGVLFLVEAHVQKKKRVSRESRGVHYMPSQVKSSDA